MLHSSIPRIPFTRSAYEKMQQDVLRLEQEREAVMGRLKVAREMGDLSENGAYKYAKFELGNIHRELRRLKHLIEYGEIVESAQSNTVEFGSQVTVFSQGKRLQFLLVSQHESDPSQGKLSFQSPIGKALLGHKLGDEVMVTTPLGKVMYKITAIQ